MTKVRAFVEPVGSEAKAMLTSQFSELMKALGKNYVLYYPSLSKITGSSKSALWLGHAIYASRAFYRGEAEGRDGWFWKTIEELELATALTRREQESVRTHLTELGLLETQRIGTNRRNFYRLRLGRLGYLLSQKIQAETEEVSWTWDELAMRTLLGSVFAVYAPLAKVSGDSANGAIYTSRLLSELRGQLQNGTLRSDGFFEAQQINWARIQLGEKPIAAARATLEAAGIIHAYREAKKCGKLFMRLDINNLYCALLAANEEAQVTPKTPHRENKTNLGLSKNAAQKTVADDLASSQNAASVSPKTRHLFLQKRVTEESSNSQSASPVVRFGRKPYIEVVNNNHQHLSKPVNTTLSEVESEIGGGGLLSLSTLWTETNQFSENNLLAWQNKNISNSNSNLSTVWTKKELIFPSFTLPEEKPAMLALLETVPTISKHQVLLDEVAGNRNVRNSVVYLSTLVKKELEGKFLPTAAIRVKTLRDREAQRIEAATSHASVEPILNIQTINKEEARKKLADAVSILKKRPINPPTDSADAEVN